MTRTTVGLQTALSTTKACRRMPGSPCGVVCESCVAPLAIFYAGCNMRTLRRNENATNRIVVRSSRPT
eukprot:2182874-Pyramimonas_sp.AAC.1